MELDAKRFSDNTTLDTDVCIVGGGPAGLVVAAELAQTQCDVIVLESGAYGPEAEILALNDGDTSGDVYAGLGQTRHRQAGGTVHLWNSAVSGHAAAKYAPLDAADFEPKRGREHSGWPFQLEELRADYSRAQRICGLGPFEYDGSAWSSATREPYGLHGSPLTSRVYQVGTRESLLAPLRATIARATNVRLCTHATVVALHRDPSARRISRLSMATPNGARWSVRAKRVVLAGGAVENARLLLLTDAGLGVMGNESGWVGRGFMEHPRDRALTLRPHSPDLYARSAFYDQWRATDGTWIVGRLALSDVALASGELLNASASLFPRLGATRQRLRSALPFFAANWMPGEGHGWSTKRGAARAYQGLAILLNLEQSPHPDNRVTLSARTDSLGVPLPALHWRWRADDQARLERVRAIVARELAPLGAVSIDSDAQPDPNAHHHAGTTRMHEDPQHGVVNADARVHGTENVYVTGASTFPTAGFANPMLTIVALSVRLARHLDAAR